ncbi:uncharacterized protein PHACADRAFT_107559 [Phanerochaete carnosa HHB-10118-sp]|uniref:HAT C-terminal dimerisation domain-containing protein n=1 Tax=Phanerochaete carnosa (strain HHB-10118-sp) TaxID=650164 RepID=K5VR86_PHACS|nr:uncharacterized protein PHACADRAFT_107559 [Phanerochaete carnosa HHB-10118-sp]EKM49089.1 hypothetical protein PHACADRAFT_107559 [Phanerochaete carnosa HHB-10118-sp]
MASTTTLSFVSEPETQQQKAHNLLFKTKAKALAARTVEQEWFSYIAEPTDPSVDALVYWQASNARFPTIYSMAIDILPIQGSAVPCERIFSSGKMTATDQRNRMGGDLIEELQMLKFQFKQNHSLSFTQGLGMDEKIFDLESLGKQEIYSYVATLK